MGGQVGGGVRLGGNEELKFLRKFKNNFFLFYIFFLGGGSGWGGGGGGGGRGVRVDVNEELKFL